MISVSPQSVSAVLTRAGFECSRQDSPGFLIRESFYEPGALTVDHVPSPRHTGFNPGHFVEMLAKYAATLATAGYRALLLENGTYLVVAAHPEG